MISDICATMYAVKKFYSTFCEIVKFVALLLFRCSKKKKAMSKKARL